MSAYCYRIKGFGVKIDDISQYIDSRKVVEYLVKNSTQRELNDILNNLRGTYKDGASLEDVIIAFGYDSLACLIAESSIEKNRLLTYDTDCDGRDYVYLPAGMPWQFLGGDPQTEEEARSRIADCVLRFVNAPRSVVEDCIGDLDVEAIA